MFSFLYRFLHNLSQVDKHFCKISTKNFLQNTCEIIKNFSKDFSNFLKIFPHWAKLPSKLVHF